MTLRARLAALVRRLLPPSRPPVVAHPIPCVTCRGLRGFATIGTAGGYVWLACAACRNSPGVEGWGFHRPGVNLGSLSADLIDAEGASEWESRLSRLSDEEARARIAAEVRRA